MPEKRLRPWQEVAAELTKETNSDRLHELCHELDEAFCRRDRDLALRSADIKSRRLLFVDDEENIRATLPVILRDAGFNVEVAATVSESIQKIQKQEFDMLLSDLNIQEAGDGFIVIRAFRQFNPNRAVVILTGYPGFDSAIEGIHEKIDDYLTKPVDPDLLIATIRRFAVAPVSGELA